MTAPEPPLFFILPADCTQPAHTNPHSEKTMSIPMLEPVTLSRRSMLKTGLMGTLMLTGASTLAQLQGCQSLPATTDVSATGAHTWRLLRPKDRVILAAVAPVALADAFPQDRAAALDTFLPQVDTFLFSTSTANHAALAQLFDLLDIGIVRIMLTGMWSSWESASDAQINDFLNGWRTSSMNQLRLGYAQLTQVLSLVWYAQPGNIAASIYPGPPVHTPTPVAHRHNEPPAAPARATSPGTIHNHQNAQERAA